jgi:mannose-6-phosphate isomerase-like protein (cupin superfamily)
MKNLLLIFAIVLTGAANTSADESHSGSATYVSHEQLTTLFTNGGGIAKGGNYSAGAMHRSSAGAAEMHDKQTDVYYVEAGQGTLVTGGTLLDDKIVAPGQHQGSGIKGGEVHHLATGDVVVIPAGVPHWFKEVPHSINYLLIKAETP